MQNMTKRKTNKYKVKYDNTTWHPVLQENKDISHSAQEHPVNKYNKINKKITIKNTDQ